MTSALGTIRPGSARRSQKSRTAILDAAEQLMREDGHAAVSSRRIGTKAGLKSQLVHYYFETMNDLYLAVLHRIEDRYFKLLIEATASPHPLLAIWEVCSDPEVPRLTKEFLAMATHHPRIREEIARSAERTRLILQSQIGRALAERGEAPVAEPAVLAVLIDAVARLIVADTALGTTMWHSEAAQFVRQHLERLDAAGPCETATR